MTAYLIEDSGTGGLPAYYDPSAGAATGHGIHGWTQDKSAALGFASAEDAQHFINALLPRQASTLRPVPYKRGQ